MKNKMMILSKMNFSVIPVRLLAFMFVIVAATALPYQAVQAKAAPASFADLADRLLPAVVNISTTQVIEGRAGQQEMPQFPPGSPFEDFFKDF